MNLHDRDLIRMAKKEGVLEGIDQGIKQGLQQGIQQGVKQGLQQGIQQGQAQAKLESAITAVKKYKASLEDVSKDFGVPLETLQQALKEA